MQPGQVVRLRYATKVSSSNQGRGVRQVRVLEGEHEDSRFQRGPIITVEDLSDPHNPGQLKNLYVHRISDVEGMSDGDSDNTDGDSDTDEESIDQDDLVTVCRADSVDGIVLGRVVARRGRSLTIKALDSRHTSRVDRRHVRKTSLATINRKIGRRKYGRRLCGLGPVV
jgi:hypothetical protein